jgi:hypothetical protein
MNDDSQIHDLWPASNSCDIFSYDTVRLPSLEAYTEGSDNREKKFLSSIDLASPLFSILIVDDDAFNLYSLK